MTKKNRNNELSTPRTDETSEPTEPTMTTENTQPTENTETPVPTELAVVEVDHGSMAYMIPALPHLKESLLKTRRVQLEEFDVAVERLTAQQQDAFQALAQSLNPNQEYMDSDSQGLQLNVLKMDQGSGDDPAKPATSVKGAIYSKPAGELLTVPQAFAARTGLPTHLKVYVLAMWNGRTFFAPKGPDGKPIPPPGVDLRGNAPVCNSFDRKKGTRFGNCASCAYRPFANGTVDRDACKDNVDLFLCLEDLSNIFQLQVSATSFTTLTKYIETKLKAAKKKYPWDMPFILTTKLIQKPGQNQAYYVWEAKIVETDKEPNGASTPENVKPLLELFARQLKTEKHLPRLASVYAANANQVEVEIVGEANADAIAAAAGGMDYSSAGSGNV